MLQKRQGMSSGTCTASGRAPSQGMEKFQPHPTSSGTRAWGAKGWSGMAAVQLFDGSRGNRRLLGSRLPWLPYS